MSNGDVGMRVGVVFPQIEIGADPGAIRAYAAAISELGYGHLVVYDHVLTADAAVHRNWSGWFDPSSIFHEPLVLFAYLAALTTLDLATGVIILPQRQTALVAKQAAEVDVLSGGRLRLGVGIGWNAIEYGALGKDFTDRGARMSEQIELLRALWTQSYVSFSGRYEQVAGAGIAPLPLQRPIPVWIGAGSNTTALRRVGRIADGWFPLAEPGPELTRALAVVHAEARRAGRDPHALGMEGIIDFKRCGVDGLEAQKTAWRAAGATHLSVDTMLAGLNTVDDHIAVLASAAKALVE